ERGEFTMDTDGQAEMVGVVLRKAAEVYGFDPAAIAFSKNSVLGARHWLAVTDPPALQGDFFRRRHAASALAALWHVDALHRGRTIPFGTRFSLNGENEERLARVLLLDADALSRALEVTARTEGTRRLGVAPWLTTGTEGGFGRWLLLAGPCP